MVLLYAVVLSPYISSWLPFVGGMPAGPLIRQIIFGIIFISCFFCTSYSNNIFRLYFVVCISTVVSFFYNSSSFVQYAAGVGSFIFYPAVFLFAVIIIDGDNLKKIKNIFLIYDKFFIILFIILAFVGAMDVAMQGELVKILGYNPNYGGGDFSLITTYNGVVRANAGISDALAFGYLMAVAVIYFFNRLSRVSSWVNVLGIGVCTLACVLSLTRGAIISLFFTYIFYIFTMRRFIIVLTIIPFVGYVVYFSPYADLFFGRFTDSDQASEHSSLLRLVMALNSIEFLSQNPMGVGIGSQGAGNIFSDNDNRLNTDNYFFHILLELGLFGGPIFVYYLYRQFIFAFEKIKKYKFIASYIILFFISSTLSSSIAFATLGVIYWFVLFLVHLESKIFYEN